MSSGRMGFFRNFLRNPRSVGSIVPSSSALARAMVRDVDFTASFVVELGCGTGSMTRIINEQLRRKDNYLGFEVNPEMHRSLTKRFHGLNIVGASAAELAQHLPQPDTPVNVIVSSLPFTSLPPYVSLDIIRIHTHALAPGGIFRLFLYAHTFPLPRNQALLRIIQNELMLEKVETVFWNLPPARVITFRKAFSVGALSDTPPGWTALNPMTRPEGAS